MVQMDQRRMCPHCRAFITAKDRTCPYCNEPVGHRAIDRRYPSPILGGMIPHARFNTTTILLVNFGLYVATTMYSMKAGTGTPFRASTRRRWYRSAPNSGRTSPWANGGGW